MASIINGLFAGRSGIAAHGVAIAVVGDNISNSSTIGFKSSTANFEDLVSGGQATGRVVGSGAQIATISSNFSQGTLESTGRQLDLAVAGNGFFVVDNNGQRAYTRAGNFKINAEGKIVNQNGLEVLGFPSGGTGALEALSVNSIAQDNVGSSNVSVSGNLNAAATLISNQTPPNNVIPTVGRAGSATASTTTYTQLSDAAAFSTVVDVFDSLGASHSMTFFFFKTGANQYTAQGFVNGSDVTSTPTGAGSLPRLLSSAPAGTAATESNIVLNFNSDGTLASQNPTTMTYSIPWANGSSASSLTIDFSEFTQFSSASNVTAITQDGKGVGSVGSLSIGKNGDIFAILSNGQSAIIGTFGLVNFSNPEGLTRTGSNLLQQSPDSGEPIVGRPDSGTLGSIESGRVELSTVDIAEQFVKLITLQRGFQANSRIITTINQLLNDIIQLA